MLSFPALRRGPQEVSRKLSFEEGGEGQGSLRSTAALLRAASASWAPGVIATARLQRRQGIFPAGTIETTRSIGSGAVLPVKTTVRVHTNGLWGRGISSRKVRFIPLAL